MKNSYSIHLLALIFCGVSSTGHAHVVVRMEAGWELQVVQPDWPIDASQIWRPRISEETNHSSCMRRLPGVQLSHLAETGG